MLAARMDARDVIAALDAPSADRRELVKRLEVDAPSSAVSGALACANLPLTRQIAADILGRRADVGASQALIAALRDEDAGVRSSAADALGTIMLAHGPAIAPEAGAALLAAYGAEDDAGVRHMLIAGLGAARHREAIPLVRAAAKSDDRGLAVAARWALERLE